MSILKDGYSKFTLPITIKVTMNEMIRYKLKMLLLKRYKYKLMNKQELN